MGFSLVHPALLAAGILLAGLPLVIHLLTRRPSRHEPWAAMAFLQAAVEKSRRRTRLEDRVLLLLRALMLIVLGLALSRPIVAPSSLGAFVGGPSRDYCIVLDDSFSMRARRSDGRSAFDAARDAAIRLIQSATPGDRFALVSAVEPASTKSPGFSSDPTACIERLTDWTPTYRKENLAAALREASACFRRVETSPGNRVVCILSDLTQSSLDVPSPAVSSQSNAVTDIDRILVADFGPESRNNIHIAAFQRLGSVVAPGLPATFEITVAGFGSAGLQDASIEILDGPHVVARSNVGAVRSAESVTVRLDAAPEAIGDHRLTARLVTPVADVLPDDDLRRTVVRIGEPLKVLCVDGRAHETGARRELFYFETAVAPSESSWNRIAHVNRIAPSRMDRQVLDDYQIIVLGNVAPSRSAPADRLEAFVRRGGGLILFLGDQTTPEEFDEWLRPAPGFLPFRPESIKHVAAGEAPFRLTIAAPAHAALADFKGNDRGGLRSALVHHYWRMRLNEDAADAECLLRLSTGDPALLSLDVGAGRVLVWTIGAGLAWSNLPAKPDYLPLTWNLTALAARGSAAGRTVRAGETIVHRLAAHQVRQDVAVERPDGRRVALTVEKDDDGARCRYDGTDATGFYTVEAGGDTYAFAVNDDASDSDLKRGTAAALKAAADAPIEVVSPEAMRDRLTTAPPRELAGAVLVGLVCLLGAETFLGMWLGARR